MSRSLFYFSALCLAVSGALSYQIYATPSEITQQAPEQASIRKVIVQRVNATQNAISIRSGGIVTAAEQVQVSSLVSGEIVAFSPLIAPGAFVLAGDEIARIDQTDFQLAVNRAQANVRIAKADLAIEKGLVKLAEAEFKVASGLINTQDPSLAKRQPQLMIAEQNYSIARNALTQAKLSLERTQIHAPINGYIKQKSHARGDYISAGSSLIELVGTQTFWLTASVSLSDLPWITENSIITVSHPAWPSGSQLEAKLVHKLNDLRSMDRQAQILISLSPAQAHAQNLPLMIDQYLDVKIETPLQDLSILVEKSWLKDRDYLWTLDANNALQPVKIEPIHRARDSVLIAASDLDSTLVLTSTLISATAGMRVEPIVKKTTSAHKGELSQ